MKPSTIQTYPSLQNGLRSLDMHALLQFFEMTADFAVFVNDAEGRYIAVNEFLLTCQG